MTTSLQKQNKNLIMFVFNTVILYLWLYCKLQLSPKMFDKTLLTLTRIDLKPFMHQSDSTVNQYNFNTIRIKNPNAHYVFKLCSEPRGWRQSILNFTTEDDPHFIFHQNIHVKSTQNQHVKDRWVRYTIL